MCPVCFWEEEVHITIRRLPEEIYKFFFACVLSFKEEVEIDEPLSHSQEKQQGGLLTIVRDTEVGEP